MGNETIEVLELMTSGIKVCKFLRYTSNFLLILHLFSQNVKTYFFYKTEGTCRWQLFFELLHFYFQIFDLKPIGEKKSGVPNS